MTHPASAWLPVVEASNCIPCDTCGELLCPVCLAAAQDAGSDWSHRTPMPVHYADCGCPGPHQDDEFEYRVDGAGNLEARSWL